MMPALQNKGLVECYILVWKTHIFEFTLQTVNLMDISNTHGRDLKFTVLLSLEKLIFILLQALTMVEFAPKRKERENSEQVIV